MNIPNVREKHHMDSMDQYKISSNNGRGGKDQELNKKRL